MASLGSWIAPLVAGALVAAGLVATPAHADAAIDGPLTSGDSLFPNQGNGGYDVSHYDVDLAWTLAVPPSQSTIDATTTITATTTGPPLSSFGLDLEGLNVTSVEVNGDPAVYTRIDQADTETPGQHKLVVTPATPVSGAFTVVVEYGGVPSTRHDTDGSDEGWIPTPDGATFLNQPIGSMTGFPNNNTPKDKATYTFRVNVPDALEVVSNGEPQGTFPPTPSGGRATWVWNQTQPMASELALVSIGDYHVINSTVTLPSRTIPTWSFIDAQVWAASSTTIESRLAELGPVLSDLEALLGPYPGQSTGIVVDTTHVGYALETQDRPTWPTAGSVTGSFEHELTHQWYGDAVAPADWNGLWVNEGMATWAPVRLSGASTEDVFFDEWSTTSSTSNLWKVPSSGMTVPVQLFGWQSYDRGAMTYEALRASIGDPAFFQLIKQWQSDFGGQTKKWTDLIALAEQLSGQDLTAFFQDWLCDADKPAWPPATPTPSGAPCAPLSTGPPPTGPPPTTPPGLPVTFGTECQASTTGKPRVGKKLTAHLKDCPAGTVVTSYQWFVNGRPIAGATGATYKLKHSKLGKRISVDVTVSAPGYVDAQRVSRKTRKVR